MASFNTERLETCWRSPKAENPQPKPSAKKSDRAAIRARIEEHKIGTQPTFEEGVKRKIAEYKAAKKLSRLAGIVFILFQACSCAVSKDWNGKSPILSRTPGTAEEPLPKEQKWLLPKETTLAIWAFPAVTPYWRTTITIPLQK